MQRKQIALLAAVLVVASVPGLVAGEPLSTSISDVEVTPEKPLPGDEITITATIENFASSSEGFIVDKVAVRTAGDDDDLAKVEDIGTIPTGSNKRVPLTVSFDQEGTYDLRVRAWGRSADSLENENTTYPVSLTVKDRRPQLDVDTDEAVVGLKSDGSVTISNSVGSQISDVELTVDGEGVTVDNRREVIAGLADDESQTVDFSFRPETTGDHNITATLTYTTEGGTTQTITEEVTVSAVESHPKVGVRTNESTVGIKSSGEITIVNSLGTEVSSAEVTVTSSNDDLSVVDGRSVLSSIADGSSVTTRFSYRPEAAGDHPVTVTVTYTTAGGTTRTVTETVTLSAVDSQPSLSVSANNSVVGVRSSGEVTIANTLGTKIESADVTVEGDGVTVVDERTVLTGIADGDSETTAFQFRPESPGDHTLTVTVTYTTVGGTTKTVTDTVSVTASDAHPQLDVNVNESIANTESTGSVTIANSLGTDIENVELTVSADGVTVTDDREVMSRLADGETAKTSFDFRPESAGEHTLTATLTYTTEGGTTRTVDVPVTITAEPLRDDVSVEVSSKEGGETQAVVVKVLNGGNAPITNVTVRGTSENATVQRALVSEVAPGESRTVSLNATLDEQDASVSVETTYDVGTQRGSEEAATSLTRAPGVVGLTGLNVVPEAGPGETVKISGSASNLGTTQADSVVVSVVDTDNVDPAYPKREFFVGAVPASDFVSFDVYARLDGNVSTVPVEVSYLVDGDRQVRTVEVDTGGITAALQGSSQSQQPQTSSSPGLVPIAVGGVIVVVVLGIIALAWRKSRGGD